MTLSAERISLSLGGRRILDSVTFAAGAGETIGLLGPNGSGKSTLLRVLAGIRRPDSGRVELDGEDVQGMRRARIARRIAVVSQHSDTEVDVTVEDVVRLGRIPHRGIFGSDEAGDAEAVEAALLATGTDGLRGRRWSTLSGGERQRTQIARALAQQPTELLLDEPTNHLDIAHQLDILALVRELPLTSVVALHDLNLAAMFCDRVIVLEQGAVVAAGTPTEVIDESLVSRVYQVKATVTADPTDGYPTVRYRPR